MADPDSDWDYPLTDEDLRVIDSAISSAPPPKRHHDDASSAPSAPKARRRFPGSLFAFREQQQRDINISSYPFSRCSSRSYCRRSSYPVSRFQELNFGGRIVYSRTATEVERAAQELLDFIEAKKRTEGECILGLDIEWRPTFRKGAAQGKAAVMQICADNRCCHVLHIIHSGITKSLRNLLEDQASLKVGVAIANDVNKILRDYDVSVNTSQDLSNIANQKLGEDPKKWSLSSLTERLICKQLPKPNTIRLGNWEAAILSTEQLKYAATDAYISWYLYKVLNHLPDPVVNEATKMNVT